MSPALEDVVPTKLPPLDQWGERIIAPVPFMDDLRNLIVTLTPKRCPRWLFRYAPDLGIAIHPRPADPQYRRCLFECRALQVDGLRREWLEEKTRREWPRASLGLDFWIGEASRPRGESGPPMWAIKPRRRFWIDDSADWGAFRDRVDAAIVATALDERSGMSLLADRCLACGKGMYDPISMARTIGPECAARFQSWTGKYVRPPVVRVAEGGA